MAVKTINSLLLNNNGIFSNDIRQLISSKNFGEETDIKWISEVSKQQLNIDELDQMLNIIDDFFKKKKAETNAEKRLVTAFKLMLTGKKLVLIKSNRVAR